MVYKEKISIRLKSNGDLFERVYTVARLDHAVCVKHVYNGKTQTVRVGDSLTEEAAQNLVKSYHVTVTL